jgi:hypothetical protein
MIWGGTSICLQGIPIVMVTISASVFFDLGTCFQITIDHFQDTTTIGTGYGYYVASLVFVAICTLLLIWIRRRAGEDRIMTGERAALRSSTAAGGRPSLPDGSSVYSQLPVASPIDRSDEPNL